MDFRRFFTDACLLHVCFRERSLWMNRCIDHGCMDLHDELGHSIFI